MRLTVPLAPLLPPRLLQEASEQVAVQQGACKAEGNSGTTLSAASNPSTAEGKVDVELGEEKLEVAPLQAPLQVEIPSDTSRRIPWVPWVRKEPSQEGIKEAQAECNDVGCDDVGELSCVAPKLSPPPLISERISSLPVKFACEPIGADKPSLEVPKLSQPVHHLYAPLSTSTPVAQSFCMQRAISFGSHPPCFAPPVPPVCIQKEGTTNASVVFKKLAAVNDGDAEEVQVLFGDAALPHEELIEGIKMHSEPVTPLVCLLQSPPISRSPRAGAELLVLLSRACNLFCISPRLTLPAPYPRTSHQTPSNPQ